MNRHVNAIAGRLSLRAPQRRSLEILDRITEILPQREQRTNELSELIYAVTEPLQAFRGYLAVFCNLTDAQPLANSALQRLAEQDAQQQTLHQPHCLTKHIAH